MTIGVCCLLAMLLANPAGEMTVARAEVPELLEPGFLISRNEAIADLDRVCVSLVTSTADAAAFEGLAAQVAEKLKAKGIEHVECKTGVTPRLHIHIETIGLEECGRTVYRVQTALSRIVTFTDHRELAVQADVWRVKPVMEGGGRRSQLDRGCGRCGADAGGRVCLGLSGGKTPASHFCSPARDVFVGRGHG